jgi:hypothetical protein
MRWIGLVFGLCKSRAGGVRLKSLATLSAISLDLRGRKWWCGVLSGSRLGLSSKL